MLKFLLPSIYNNHKVETPEGVVKSTGLGAGMPLEFMSPQLMMAAQKAGYETYSVMYDSVKKEESGEITADLVKVEINHAELLNRIMTSENNFRGLTEVFDRALSRRRVVVLEETKEIEEKVKELSDLAVKDEEQEKELTKQKAFLSSNQESLSNEKNWHYSIWDCNMQLRALSQYVTTIKDEEMIAYFDEIAAQEPARAWDKDLPFLKRERINAVPLKEFLEVGQEQNQNVFYIRDFKEGEQFHDTTECFRELENLGVKFPTSVTTLDLHEKIVVKENKDLADLTFPIDYCGISETQKVIDFYRNKCQSEGLVIKPYFSFGGQGILFLEGGISDVDLPQKVEEKILAAQKLEQELNGRDAAKGTIDFSQIILQKKLYDLNNDSENQLYGGDIRFTAINGELFGGALRFSKERGEKALSYAKCRNLLPDQKLFTAKNIEAFVELASAEGNQDKLNYYENLRRTFDVAEGVTNWCKENGHFHVGFDVLIGRDSAGNWKNCLTELNVGWPDCIPETRWLNAECGASADKVNICDTVVGIVQRGEYISPLKVAAQKIKTGSSPENPKLGKPVSQNQLTIS